MQKWEYCEIVYNGGTFVGSEQYKLIIHHLPEDIVSDIKGEMISSTITQLGLDGWELVSAYEEKFGHKQYWFFKRPLQ